MGKDRRRVRDGDDAIAGELDGQTVALRVIAGVLILGAMHLLATALVPFFLALVLAIALSPLADRVERLGFNRTISSLACLALVGGVLLLTSGLVIREAGAILRNSDEHLEGFSRVLSQASERLGLEGAVGTLDPPSEAEGSGESAGQSARGEDASDSWQQTLRENARVIGRWVLGGLGGLLGFAGGVVVFLAFLFYMLLTRSAWIERLRRAGASLGLHPDRGAIGAIRGQMQKYIGVLAMVSLGYVVIVTLALWAIGVPKPLLWGILTGLLEVVPYFGPVIASALPTIMALSIGQGIWPPLMVLGLFIVLQGLEGYVVTPMLYGSAVEIDPVTVLLGVLVFGLVWGPLGLACAMPMLIILRGILAITPETPALDALVEADEAVESSR